MEIDPEALEQGSVEDIGFEAFIVPTRFLSNQAIGGDGGEKLQTSEPGGSAGDAGNATGGAIHQQSGGTLEINEIVVSDNFAFGGFGGIGNRFQAEDCDGELCVGQSGGSNGDAFGGGIAADSQLTLTDSLVIANVADGGVVPRGGRIAAGAGGADEQGDGQTGGSGGSATGGGLLTRAQASITGTSITVLVMGQKPSPSGDSFRFFPRLVP